MDCLKCKNKLEYVASFGAPGIGQEWECVSCKTSHHVVGTSVNILENVDPEDLVTSIESER